MPLASPIIPLFFDDPAIAYSELAAILQPGKKYVQPFDHFSLENPLATEQRRLGEMYPNATVLGTDMDVNADSTAQTSLGACGTYANINAFAAVPVGCKYRLEEAIYPLEPSPIGAYFVRVQSPDNPLETKWVLIDDQVPTMPGKNSSNFFSVRDCLAPGLFLKAAATMRGGAWNEITNSGSFGIRFNWFPSTLVDCKTADELHKAISVGSLCVFSMTQQFNQMGEPISVPGVVLGHAFSVTHSISTTGVDGLPLYIYRISNPWGGGSEYIQSICAEGNDDFWNLHSELATQRAESQAIAGTYFVTWDELCRLTGRTSFDVTHPLPLPEYPYVKCLKQSFTDETAIAYSPFANLANLAQQQNNLIEVSLSQSSLMQVNIRWQSGTGSRNTAVLATGINNKPLTKTSTVFGGGTRTVPLSLKGSIGKYRLYPFTDNMMEDRGDLWIMFSSRVPFELKVGGVKI